MTTARLPCASSAASTAPRISASVSAVRSTSGPLRYSRWICCNLVSLLEEPKAPKIIFRIDQYCRRPSQRGDEDSHVQIARPKSSDRICVDVNDTTHHKGSAQPCEGVNRVRDAEHRTALRCGGDLPDECRA